VFRRLWAAITVSSLGDWLGLLATTAMAQQLTRDESLAVQGAAISGVILTRLLPDLVLGPFAGALADKLTGGRRSSSASCWRSGSTCPSRSPTS
jgi:dTMP kinase